MAAVTPAPQQHLHRASAAAHTLDNLQAMMNLVLIQSGQFIKTHQASTDPSRGQFTLKRAVTAASERFHDSLDELENELHMAQTVIRRDLAWHKANRKKREADVKQREAEQARLAAESSTKKSVPQAPVKQEASPPRSTTPVAPIVKTEPSVTATKPPESPPAPAPTSAPAAEPAAPVGKAEAATPSEPPPAPAPAEDATMENTDNLENETTQQDDFDFDALFNDTMMDASGEGGDDPDDMNLDTTGPDLNFSLDDGGPTLLRGLEDFAKSSDDDTTDQVNTDTNLDLDFAMPDMPDMPDLAAAATSEQPSITKPPEEPAAQQPTNDNDVNLDTITTDTLDDLFDLDYENPEATQFDDAFFGFGES